MLTVKTLSGGAQRAVLHNLSSQVLLVTITVSNNSTPNKYITQVSVPPGDLTKIDGLPTAPGDRVVLASAGYREQVSQVN
jgi:hypothetical protein